MCNSGGAAALLESHLPLKAYMRSAGASTTRMQLEKTIGAELGVVRVSLGLGTNWKDVHTFVEFAKVITLRHEDENATMDIGSKDSNTVQVILDRNLGSRRSDWKILRLWDRLRTRRVSLSD
jgi:hypothetical protein